MGNRYQGRGRMGVQPAIRDLLQYIEKDDGTTSLDVTNNIVLGADSRYAAFGAAGVTDSSIYFDGTSLTFKDSLTGTKTLAQLSAASSTTLQQAYTNGNLITGATASGATTAFRVGNSTAAHKIEMYHDATDGYIYAVTGDLYLKAEGGDVKFDNENLLTTGTLGAGAITGTSFTDSTATLSSGILSACVGITSANAIYIKPSGDTDDYITFTTTAHVPIIGTSGACNLKITADSGTIDFDNELLTTTGTLTVQGIVNTTVVIDTTAAIQIGADNVNLTLGASDATDSKIYFDGSGNLTFWDSNLGATATLSSLAGGVLTSPVVAGDMTITDGKLTWTDAAAEIAGTWTFANTTTDGIDMIMNSLTTANGLHIQSTSMTSGSGVNITTNEGIGAGHTGSYLNCYDSNGAASVFTVKKYGVTTISGAASTDVLVLTAGDMQITAGDIDIDLGRITIDNTADEGSTIKRNNATGTAAVLIVGQEHITGGLALHVDQDATGDINALQIDNAGTGFSCTTSPAAAGGGGYEYISGAGTAPGFLADGATGGAAWVGAAATGMFTARSDGVLADVAASMFYAAYSGNAGGANQTGSCFNAVETGAVSGTSNAVGISSTNNRALYAYTGAVGTITAVFDKVQAGTASIVKIDATTGTGWIGAAATGALQITGDGNLNHAGAGMLNIAYSGQAANSALGSCLAILDTGAAAGAKPAYVAYINTTNNDGLNIVTGLAGASNFVCSGINGQTGSMVYLDGTTGGGWIGADAKGILSIAGGGALAHVNSTGLLITMAGTGQAASMGTSLRIVDTCNAGAGSYAVYISATDADSEAIKVDAGKVVVDETLTATGGVITLYSAATDLTATPTGAEFDALMGENAPAGMIGIIKDSGNTPVYLVTSDGADNWYVALTKAV